MKNKFSLNAEGIQTSGIRKFYNLVNEMPDAISLTLGQPDFNIPEVSKLAIIDAVQKNKTGYTPNEGIPELRKEISNYLKSLGVFYESDEICITIGGSEGILATFAALINYGDKVLIPNPSYPAYESCVKLLGGEVVYYFYDENFNIDIEAFIKIIKKEHPKIIVISFPSNPSGAIMQEKAKEELNNILKDEDIFIISDEMYAPLIYDGFYYSLAQYNELKERIIYISGFSKMFSMTGLRVGYICTEKEIMKQILKVHQLNVSCAPSISQWGALSGLRYCLDYVEQMKKELIVRRDYIYNRLISMGFETTSPEGAFYIFPSVRRFGLNSEAFCRKLLYEGKVAIVPGSAFGTGGEGYARISYCCNLKKIKTALDRIENWI